MPEALFCFEEQLRMGFETGKDFGTNLVGIIRCTRDFYDEHHAWVKRMVEVSGVPMLIEVLSERVHYWVAKVDLAAIDGQGRPIENPTVQIDVESSVRFDIKYHRDGEVIHPPILHCSPTGSVERVICAMLEHTASQDVPRLPTWLSPTQVRVIPVAERHVAAAGAVASRIRMAGIRADLDDRDESVGKKVREAGMDWVPFVAVIGDAEKDSGTLAVTVRAKSKLNKPHKETMTEDVLIDEVKEETAGMPFRPLYTPALLSKKARFI
jgi:threonyl-tRNA synthetase